jgi:hypothetical protein
MDIKIIIHKIQILIVLIWIFWIIKFMMINNNINLQEKV